MWTMEVPGAWKISVSVYIRIGSGFLTLISFGTRISIGAAKSCLNEYPPLCHAYTPRIFPKNGFIFQDGRQVVVFQCICWLKDRRPSFRFLSDRCMCPSCRKWWNRLAQSGKSVSGKWKIVWRRTQNHSAEIEFSFGTGLFTAFCHERKLKDGFSVLHSITCYMISSWHAAWKMKALFWKTLGGKACGTWKL